MKKLTPEKFVELLREAGYKPKPYSGRGMYGEYCVGITASGSGFSIGADLASIFAIEGLTPPEPNTDSMGKGLVYYWPAFPWPKQEDAQ